jgi:hypothetical protein
VKSLSFVAFPQTIMGGADEKEKGAFSGSK